MRASCVCECAASACYWWCTSVEIRKVIINLVRFVNRVFGANNSSANRKEEGQLFHYGCPALDVNENRDVAIVYTRTNSNTFPQMRYSAYLYDEVCFCQTPLVSLSGYTGSISNNSSIVPKGINI